MSDKDKAPPPESTVDSDYGRSSFETTKSKDDKPEPPKPGLENSADNEAAKK